MPDVILEMKEKQKKKGYSWGPGIKIDFMLKLLNKKINEGFLGSNGCS